MRIALINENSQAGKNELIYNTLQMVASKYGHTVDNYGMFTAPDKPGSIRKSGRAWEGTYAGGQSERAYFRKRETCRDAPEGIRAESAGKTGYFKR